MICQCILQVPLYIVAQIMGSTLASAALTLAFHVTPNSYFGTVPVGSNGQSLFLEILISFLLMFVVSGVGTDSRAVCTPNMYTLIFLLLYTAISFFIHKILNFLLSQTHKILTY